MVEYSSVGRMFCLSLKAGKMVEYFQLVEYFVESESW